MQDFKFFGVQYASAENQPNSRFFHERQFVDDCTVVVVNEVKFVEIVS
jgi:hypothetical protein